MIYDAIINGARSLAFYGGNSPDCWNGTTDNQHGWNWTFWDSTLRSLIGEISPISPLSPALVNPVSTAVLPTNDASTEVIESRRQRGRPLGAGGACRLGNETGHDLGPASVSDERRRLHREPLGERGERRLDRQLRPVGCPHLPPRAAGTTAASPAPTIASVTPTSGPVGSRVTVAGTNLGSATAVTFAGLVAGFTVTSSTELSATVPAGATSGPIAVTTPVGTATSSVAFTVTAASPPPPPSGGGGSSGGQAIPSSVRLTASATSPSLSVGGTDDIVLTAVDVGGGSSHVILTITLPSGLALVGPPGLRARLRLHRPDRLGVRPRLPSVECAHTGALLRSRNFGRRPADLHHDHRPRARCQPCRQLGHTDDLGRAPSCTRT